MSTVILKETPTTPEQIWCRHKELLVQAGYADVIALYEPTPSDEDFAAITDYRKEVLKDPPDPVIPDINTLRTIVQELATSLQVNFSMTFPTPPEIQMVDLETYSTEGDKLEAEEEKYFGSKSNSSTFPPFNQFPWRRLFLFPATYVVEETQGRGTELTHAPWSRSYLRHCMQQTLVSAFFRTSRDEWGPSYIQAMHELGPSLRWQSHYMENLLNMRIAEARVPEEEKLFALHTVADIIQSIWQFNEFLELYQGLDTIMRDHSIYQASLPDSIHLSNGGRPAVSVDFYESHPNHLKKERNFEKTP